MDLSWRHLAQLFVLATALPGCFDSHGMPGRADAAPHTDAPTIPVRDAGSGPTCDVWPATGLELGCELRGTEGVAIVTSAPAACCSSGEPRTAVVRSGTTHFLSLDWLACDCCADCFCIGPTTTVEIPLGTLEEGIHTVTIGSEVCTIPVGPPPECVPASVDDVRMPRGLYDDQALTTTLLAPGTGGCGCDPTATVPTPSDPSASLSLCSCCWSCDCFDLGYETTSVGGVFPIGEHVVTTPLGPRELFVTTRAGASSREPIGLRVVAPSEERLVSGPRTHWAVVTTIEHPCCVEPVLLVEEVRGPPSEHVLLTSAANLDDCACIGEPTEVEGWYPIVDLASGTHRFRAGAQVVEVVVP